MIPLGFAPPSCKAAATMSGSRIGRRDVAKSLDAPGGGLHALLKASRSWITPAQGW
jgi:hypothetical protein